MYLFHIHDMAVKSARTQAAVSGVLAQMPSELTRSSSLPSASRPSGLPGGLKRTTSVRLLPSSRQNKRMPVFTRAYEGDMLNQLSEAAEYFSAHYRHGFLTSRYNKNDRFKPANGLSRAGTLSWMQKNVTQQVPPYHFSIFSGENGVNKRQTPPAASIGGFHISSTDLSQLQPNGQLWFDNKSIDRWYFDAEGKFKYLRRRYYTLTGLESRSLILQDIQPPAAVTMAARDFALFLQEWRL